MLTAKQIKAIRMSILWKGRPINQIRFARLLGTTQVTISRWENGHFAPDGPAVLVLQLLRRRPKHLVLYDLQKISGFPDRHTFYRFRGR